VAHAAEDPEAGIFFDYEPVDPDAAADPEYGARRACFRAAERPD
jgi:hypothetical protein